MESHNQHSSSSGKSYIKIWEVFKKLGRSEWGIITFTFLSGLSLFLWGYILQNNNSDIGHAIMAFAVIVSLESITLTIKIFITNIENLQQEKELFTQFKVDIIKDVKALIENSKEDIAKTVSQKIAGTQHIVEAGIENIFEGLDLNRELFKCERTTIFLQRLYFSPKEFEVLEYNILDLILNKDCTIKILLSSPSKTDIIEDRVKNCKKYKTSIGFAVWQIRLLIVKQIERLLQIIEELPPEKKNNLQIRTHTDYVVAAITGYNDIIITGLYLNDDMADDGYQEFKKGLYTKTYRLWLNQFAIHWENGKNGNEENLNINTALNS